jgi:hypothetical protein
VPDDLFADTLLELRQQFGAVSCETQVMRGLWPDTPETIQFFRDFKERLKSRFQQLDIWMTTYPIRVL